MKIKQKSIFVAVLMAISTVGTALAPVPSVGALTDKEIKECSNRWGGRSTDPTDSQALGNKDIEDFKASKCGKGSEAPCGFGPIPKSDWKQITCKQAGDGEDVTPGADVVASQIKKGNYKEYTNAVIDTKCSEYFRGKAAKRNNCISLAKERRNELRARHGENPPGGNGNNEVDACKTKTAIIPVDCSKGGNPIWGLLLMVINILTAGIGIVAIGGIVYAAILWTTAEDKNAQIVKSKTTIFNVVVGLVGFALLYAFLQFLIPGGVFSGGS